MYNTVAITSEDGTETGTYTITDDKLTISVQLTEEGMTANLNFDLDIHELTKTKMDVEGTMAIV